MSLQKEFFNNIKKNLPEHISFVDELAELFNMSTDSAYRRLRGETALTFEELALLSKKYNVSIDSLLGKESVSRVSFRYNPIDEKEFGFLSYFESLKTMLQNFSAMDNAQLIYAANEAKFGLLHVPEVAAFKLFFWMKTSYDFEESKSQKLNFDEFNQNYGKIVREIVRGYVKIPTIEIINEDYLNTTINQIRFYNESGYFNSKAEALLVCDKLKELITHNKREAELGFKFLIGQPEKGKEGNLMLYYNDIIHSDNVVAAKLNDDYFTYLVINTINFMLTSNRKFAKHTFDYLVNLKNKSTLISVSAERERNRFYNTLLEKVEKLRKDLV